MKYPEGTFLKVVAPFQAENMDEITVFVDDTVAALADPQPDQHEGWVLVVNRSLGPNNGQQGLIPEACVQEDQAVAAETNGEQERSLASTNNNNNMELSQIIEEASNPTSQTALETTQEVNEQQLDINNPVQNDATTSEDPQITVKEVAVGAKVISRYEYFAEKPDELGLQIDDVIVVLECPPGGWWRGMINQGKVVKTGWFPATLVELIPEPSPAQDAAEPSNEAETSATSEDQSNSDESKQGPRKVQWFQKLTGSGKRGRSSSVDTPSSSTQNSSSTMIRSSSDVGNSKDSSSPVVSPSAASSRLSIFDKAKPGAASAASINTTASISTEAASAKSMPGSRVSFFDKGRQSTASVYSVSSANSSVFTLPSPSPVAGPASTESWKEYVNESVIESLSELEKKRQDVIWELLLTERSYVNDLDLIQQVFAKPLNEQKILVAKHLDLIFGGLEDIAAVNLEFLQSIEERWETAENHIVDQIGDLFVTISPKLICYLSYCVEREHAFAKIQTLLKSNKQLKQFLKDAYQSGVTRNLDIGSYLIKPPQRICKYPLLIKELLKATSSDHPDRAALEQAYYRVHMIISVINLGKDYQESSKKLSEIQSSFPEEKLDIAIPQRYFIREDSIYYTQVGQNPKDAKQSRRIYLFNDSLLVVRKDWREKLHLTLWMDINGFSVLNEIPESLDEETSICLQCNTDLLQRLTEPISIVMTLSSKIVKTSWLDSLKKLTEVFGSIKNFKPDASKAAKALSPRALELVSDAVKESLESLSNLIADDRAESPNESGESGTQASLNAPEIRFNMPEQSSRPVSMIEGSYPDEPSPDAGKSRSSNDLQKTKPVNKNLSSIEKSVDSSTMSVFQSKLLEKENVISQQANTISKLNLKLNDIDRRYKELYETHMKQQTKISEASMVNKSYAQVKNELEESEKTRKRESERYMMQLDSLKRDHENLLKMLDEEKQNSNRRIEREIASTVSSHDEDIKRAKDESEMTIKSLQNVVKDLTNSNQRKSDEITRLEREKNSMLFAFNKSTGDENQDFKMWQEKANEYEATIKTLHVYLEESENSAREQLTQYHETELSLRKNLEQVITESRRKDMEKNSVLREKEILIQRKDLEVQSSRSLLSDSQESERFAWESVDLAKKDVAGKNEMIKERDVQLLEKEKFITDQKIDLNTKIETIKGLEFEIERLKDFEQNHSKLNSNVHDLHSSLRKAEKDVKKLTETKAELEQKISDQEKEIGRLKKIETEANDLKNHVEDKSKEIGRLSQITSEFDQFKFKVQVDFEKSRQELQNQDNKHLQDIEIYKSEMLKLKDTISVKEKEIESGVQMLKMTKDIVNDLEKLRDANEKELTDLRNKIKVAIALKRKLKKTEEEKLAIIEETRGLKTTVEQRDVEIQNLKAEIVSINKQKDEVFQSKQSIISERESMKLVIADMEHIISGSNEITVEGVEITEYLMRVVKKLHEFKLQKDALNDELELLRNQHQELEEIHQQQEEDLTEVVSTLKSLEEKAVQQKEQYEKMINAHINDNAKLGQQIQELINSPKTNEEAMQRWLAKFEKVQNQYVACQKELISVKADNAEIKEKLQYEDSKLHMSYSAAQTLKREIKLLQETIFRMQDEEKKLPPGVTDELKRLKDQNYYLKQALHESKIDMMNMSLNAAPTGEVIKFEKSKSSKRPQNVVNHLESALGPLLSSFDKIRRVKSPAGDQSNDAEDDDYRASIGQCVDYLQQLALLNKNFLSSVCSVLVLSDCDTSAAMSLFSIEASAKIDDIAERHSDLFSRQLQVLQSKLEELTATINGELSAKDSEVTDKQTELEEARRELQKTRETIQELRKYNESLHEQMTQVKETLNLRTMLEQAIAETQTPEYERSAEREPVDSTLDFNRVAIEDLINGKENIENEFQILLQLFGAIYDGDMKQEENLRSAFESAKYLNEINRESSAAGSISFYLKILLDRMSKFRVFLENLLRAYAKHGISLGSNIQRNVELQQLKVETEELKYSNRQLNDKLSIREKELSLYVHQLKRKESELQTIIKERTNISQMVVEACTELEHLVSTTSN